MSSAEHVVIGYVRRPHGVRGEVAVEALSDVQGRFTVGAEYSIVVPAGERQTLTVEALRRHKGAWLVRFAGVENRDAADALRGASLEVAESEVPEAPEGSYYHYELLGCTCVDRAEGELGVVTAVREDGGGLLLEISGGGRSLLVPFVQSYLATVDVRNKRIQFDLPAGLTETCVSTS